jgi:hypothetical protein
MRDERVKEQIQTMHRAGMTTMQIAAKLVVVKGMSERHVRNILKNGDTPKKVSHEPA